MNKRQISGATTVNESEGRERVLHEAHALFLDRGFAEVSMQQIADAAGMTKAALYYHFRNKEDLFAHVVRHEITRFISGVTAELDGIDSFEEQLKRFAIFVFRTRGSDFSRLIGDFKRHVSAECQEQLKLEEQTHDPLLILRPYFERAKATGELQVTDIDRAMMFFFSLVGGLYMISEQKPEMRLTDDLAVGMVNTFLRGVAGRDRAVS